MINVAVVDDQQEFLNLISDRILHFSNKRDDICIFPHKSGRTVLEEVARGVRYDIVFCDVEMEEINGMELGRILKQKWPTLYLVYLTSYSEYAAESYVVSAFQYVLKQDMTARLPAVLAELFLKIDEEHKKYRIINATDEMKKVMYTDMIFLKKEKNSKYVDIMTTEGVLRERNTLENILQEIQSREFIWVERGLVVNMKHITRIRGDMLVLSNQQQIHVSRRRLKEVKEAISKYWGYI